MTKIQPNESKNILKKIQNIEKSDKNPKNKIQKNFDK